VAAIHDARVAHKDISPANVIWKPETGEVKIIDFGVSSILDSDLVQPEAPQNLEGNLLYMSPEQTGRMNRPLDYRTDLYSLGATLFHLFTGSPPFVSDDPLELIHCHVARTPPDPCSLAPDLSRSLGDILLRLLSKRAEDRYQSATGVAHDLELAARHLKVGLTFELGRQDQPLRFIVPSALYGRDEHAAQLMGAFDRAREGEVMLTLVSGYSGVGKTSLVRELYRPLAATRGRYISGKYDQYLRNVPYSGLATAFNGLARQLLSEPPHPKQRERVYNAIGRRGQVLIEAIPLLEEVLGPQPPVPEVDPQAAKNRFHQVFIGFVAAIATPEEPLVVFLDDLQWADLASLELLKRLILDLREGGLHVVGAYRDNEVEASHPLSLVLAELEAAGRAADEIHLDNLLPEDIAQLVSDTLSRPVDEVGELVDVICDRTRGNAFFATEFFKNLASEGDLAHDGERWTWNLHGIAARKVTDNVVDFMAQRIQVFEPAAQAVLRLAACLGNSFDLETAGVALELDLPGVMEALAAPVETGVVVPLNREWQKVGIVDVPGDQVRFRFQHDRVQQAAYSLIDPEDRAGVHHGIALRLRGHAEASGRLGDRLFEVVSHFNQAITVVEGEEARLDLAGLNHAAGLKALAASAYSAAAGYFHNGRSLLPAGAFDDHYELAMALHLDLARSLYITGQFKRSAKLYPVMLKHARTPMDEVRVLIVQMEDVHVQGDYEAAIVVQKEGLSKLGLRFPADLDAAISSEVASSQTLLRGRSMDELYRAPELDSEETEAALQLLIGMWLMAYLVSKETLVQWCSVRMANLTLERGNSAYASFAYVQFAYLNVQLLADPVQGQAYGDLATRLADRYDDIEMRGKVFLMHALFVNHWTRHVGTSTEMFRKAYLASLEGGDWTYAVYGAANIVSNLLIEGRPCAEVQAEAARYHQFLSGKAEVALKSFFLGGAFCSLLDLQGRTRRRGDFDCRFLDEEDHLSTLGQLPIVEAWFYSAKLRSLFLYRRIEDAIAVAHKPDLVLEGVPSQIKVPESHFYACLILAAHHPDMASLQADSAHADLWLRYRAGLADAARHGPENMLHKVHLVDAECARLEGRSLGEVLALYDGAIASAEAAGYLNNAAIGCELKGRYWRLQGQDAYGLVELRRALAGYERWGVSGKVDHLMAEFPQLVPARQAATSTHHTRALTSDSLDLASIHKASQAISTNLDWDALVHSTLPILMENLGANRGLLLLRGPKGWSVEAAADVDGVRDGADQSFPELAVDEAAEAREPLILDGDALPDRFRHSLYFAEWTHQSGVCAPLRFPGDVVVLFYLENTLQSGAFKGRSRTLEILLSQLAISMKNARLYGEIETALALQVRELTRSNAELEQFAYVVSHDLQAPLRHIGSHIRLIEKSLGDTLTGRTKRSFGHVTSATTRMQGLVRDLLALSRLGAVELELQEVDLVDLVDGLRVLFAERIESSGAEIHLVGGHALRSDPRLIRQVFMNTVNNGLKFVAAGTRPRVTITVERAGDAQRVLVDDNGVGFPEHGRERAFQLFQRLHTDAEFEGTGLGLAICRKVVELHGGDIRLGDSPAGGARIEFTLPLAGASS
jgi:predicted ATPase/signal transduction histidine kinase